MIDTRYKNELKKLLNIWHDRNTKKIRAKKNLTVNVNREIFQMAGINLEYKNKILLEG